MTFSALSLLERLRSAGIEPGDSEDLRLQKSLMVLASGLVSVAAIAWLLIYWVIAPQLSNTLPFVLQLLVAMNLLYYGLSGNFAAFRFAQLALFLCFPFAAEWVLGGFVAASGLLLWGLLAPIGALLCNGAQRSVPWFLAYLLLSLTLGWVDFLRTPESAELAPSLPMRMQMAFFSLNFAAISSVLWLLMRFAIVERQRAQADLQEAHEQVRAEQERSERLLLNILPAPIAQRLKAHDNTIADGFPEVTVMFADIVNFTALAADMTPRQVFGMLNRIFSHFDRLAEHYGLEKIKTIGDAYMLAGGLDSDRHDPCAAVAQLALDMNEWLAGEGARGPNPIRVRIGISTGPVIAGVVGKKKFIYDLWGDTVNLASRITAEGAPGLIQCDAATHARLAGRFSFDPPHVVPLKGKGSVVVYRLNGKLEHSTAAEFGDYANTQEAAIVLPLAATPIPLGVSEPEPAEPEPYAAESYAAESFAKEREAVLSPIFAAHPSALAATLDPAHPGLRASA